MRLLLPLRLRERRRWRIFSRFSAFFAQVLGASNLFRLFAIVDRGKVVQARINPDTALPLFRYGVLNLTLNGDKILSGLGSRHGTVLHCSFNATMADDFHPTNLGQVDVAAFQLKALWVADGLLVKLAFEGGVVGATINFGRRRSRSFNACCKAWLSASFSQG